MARSIDEIMDIMIAKKEATPELAGLTSTSKVAIWRLWFYIVAFAMHTLEVLFDFFTADTNDTLANLKPHTTRWYALKAKAFQYGFPLLPDSDEFNNTGYTDEQIEASKIVNYAAVIEQQDAFSRVYLRMKLATDSDTDLAPLSADQLNAFKEYIKRVKDAGVRLQIDSLPADNIKQSWRIYYDPLILTNAGSRIDGSSATPVQDAIKGYLKNLPFNGIYVLQYHIDAVQAVPGVVICEVDSCETKFGLFDFTAMQTQYTPDAGYLRFATDEDLNIQWIAQSPIK